MLSLKHMITECFVFIVHILFYLPQALGKNEIESKQDGIYKVQYK